MEEDSIDDWLDKQIKKLIEENRPYVERFCEEYGVNLELPIEVTSENAPKIPFEPFYLFDFDDGPNGFTIEGIRRSLIDE